MITIISFKDNNFTRIIILDLTLGNNEPMRYNELFKSIEAISQKMLSQTLKSLETEGLIIRKVYPQIPPKVEYKLSDMGQSLIPIISELSKWADNNQEKMKLSRKKYKR